MKILYIVANWKENKTEDEAEAWLKSFIEYQPSFKAETNKRVIICPPYIVVPIVSGFVGDNNLPIEVGVQDISKFEGGAHTGEVSAKEAAEFANHAIIGHSERRAMGETDEDVVRKVQMALKNNIVPIVCVTNENIPIPSKTEIIAYEPIEAIGTGNPDTPENADKIAKHIKESNSNVKYVLYGGSVTSENASQFTRMENIDGVLVGGASLDPVEFSSIIQKC